jgi:hypothetical protein
MQRCRQPEGQQQQRGGLEQSLHRPEQSSA